TIGGGTLLDVRAPARKRRTPERIVQLQAFAIHEPQAVVSALLDRTPHFVDLAAFARDRALSTAQVASIAQRLSLVRASSGGVEYALSPAVWLRFQRDLLAALEAFHKENPDLPGVGLEKIRLQLDPRLPASAFRLFIQGMAAKGQVALDGAWVRLAGHEV